MRFRVLIDGQPLGAAYGTDVDEQGNGHLTDQRLYQLIRQSKLISNLNYNSHLSAIVSTSNCSRF